MMVIIETENGQMEVNLEKFLPTSLSRTRKLFRLMKQGMSRRQLGEVRNYLKERGSRKDLAARRRNEEVELQRVEKRLEEIKRERNDLEHQRKNIKVRLRVLEQDEKSSSTWIREFDYICGGKE